MRTLHASEGGIGLRPKQLDWKHYPSQRLLCRRQEMVAVKHHDVRLDVELTVDHAAMEFALNSARLYSSEWRSCSLW